MQTAGYQRKLVARRFYKQKMWQVTEGNGPDLPHRGLIRNPLFIRKPAIYHLGFPFGGSRMYIAKYLIVLLNLQFIVEYYILCLNILVKNGAG